MPHYPGSNAVPVTKAGLRCGRSLRLLLLSTGVLGSVVYSVPAWSQVVDPQPVSPVTVTPPTLSPEETRAPFRVEIPTNGSLTPPPGADGVSVSLANVEIDGEFLLANSDIAEVLAGITGRSVTLAEIYSAASKVERIYAQDGYILARISVPPQELEDGGVLRFVLTDGYIEAVDASALPSRIRDTVALRTKELEGKRQITLAEIEEALSFAADLPGISLRSTLVRGNMPGAVRLVLEGEQRLFTGLISIGNQLDPSLGRWGANLQLVSNSLFGMGEQLYGFASADYAFKRYFEGDARQRVLGGGAIVPLGTGAFSLNPEATFATTTPDTGVNVLRTRGKLRRLTLRGQGIVHKTRSEDLRIGLTVEQLDVRNDALDFAVALNRDRYMAARLAATYKVSGPSGDRTNMTVQLSTGLGDIGSINAREAAASRVPFSRLGADTDFVRLEASANTTMPIGGRFQLSLTGSAQTTFGDPVFRSEQFTLEGTDGLSSFIGGETAVDEGFKTRADLSFFGRITSAGRTRALVAPYVFGAFGAGRIAAPTVVERGSIDAWNLGAGVQASLFDRVDVKVEYARSLSRIPLLDDADRVGVNISLRI